MLINYRYQNATTNENGITNMHKKYIKRHMQRKSLKKKTTNIFANITMFEDSVLK